MKDEWKLEAERFLFDFGKHVLGKSAGGIINKLMRERGISAAWNLIKMAAQKSDPMEYLGAAIKEKVTPATMSDEDWAKVMERELARQRRTGWI